jgi:ABC-type sulfate/molybdate transport systems ATPase subunit
MEYKDILIYLIGVVQVSVSYIFLTHKSDTKEELRKLEHKILNLEKGDFVEKTVKNVIYLPETRQYFKSIFNEALEHKGRNNDTISLAILDNLKNIENHILKND